MAIVDDFSITSTGDIRYTGTTDNYTVLEFHRWLQDLADDDQYAGNDIVDITFNDPSDKSTDNIITLLGNYNITDTEAQHIYDGSIIQASGDEIYDGIVNFGAQGIHIEIMQNGALITPNYWTTGLNADSNAGISHRFMVKVRTAGADIDGRRLLGMNREFGYSYFEFKINGTARGNNVLALTHADDLNNETVAGTVATWTNITNTTEGYANIDVNNDGSDEYFFSEWDKATRSINDFYERMKWLTRRGSASTLYGLDGDLFRGITHEVVIDNPTGTFNVVEPVSWATGTGQMFAINSTTAGTKLWMQLLTGIAPINNATITGVTSTATADVNVTITERTISNPFCGLSTGSSIIGAYGFGIEAADLTASDKLFDLDNTQWIPPNNVVYTVYGLVSGEDRILVAPEAAGSIDFDQFSVSGAHSAGAPTLTIQEAIPVDTPSAGTIRVFEGSGYNKVNYTSWTGSIFSGCTGMPDCGNNDDCWLSYIDELATSTSASFTSVYNADRDLFIRNRDGGASPIKTFSTTGVLGSSGGSVTVIRTSDA